MGDLSALPITGISVGSIALASWWWIARLVLRGKLVPRQQLLDLTADRDFWRETAGVQQEITLKQGMTLEKVVATNEKLLVYAEGTQHVVEEIQRAGAGGGP